MLFVIGYGTFHCSMVFRNLNVDDGSHYETLYIVTRVSIGLLIVFGLFSFGTFIASFFVKLSNNKIYLLFDGLCARLPMIVGVVVSLIYQGMMDSSLKHKNAANVNTKEVPLI